MKSLWSSEPIEDDEIIDNGVEGTEGKEGVEVIVDDTEKVETVIDDSKVDNTTPIPETVEKIVEKIVEKDPFEGWEDSQKQLFETFKTGDLKALKGILDEMTADYDSLDDESTLREYVKRTNPKWNAEMVESELQEKYGLGIDTEDFTDSELMKFQKNLIKDADSARSFLNDSKSKVKFPEVTVATKQEDANLDNKIDMEAAQKAWQDSIEEGFKKLGKDTFKVEFDENGKKVSYDVEFEYSDEDKSKIKEDISKFNIENDFKSRYISGDSINTEKLMKDRFILDNVSRLISNAYEQGAAQGSLSRDAKIKNIDFKGENTTGFVNGDDDTVSMAKFFLSGGK